jgi:hypothetical protein
MKQESHLSWVAAFCAFYLAAAISFCGAASTPPSHPDPLDRIVTLPAGERRFLSVIHELSRQLPVPLNIELVEQVGGESTKALPSVVPLLAPLPLREVLRSFKRAYPPLRWLDDGTHVNVIIPLDSTVSDPLDDRMPVGRDGSQTMAGWMGWLATDKNLGLFPMVDPGGIGGVSRPSEPKITAHFRKGMQVREILNQLADSAGETWSALVMRKQLIAAQSLPPGGILPNASAVPSYSGPATYVLFHSRAAADDGEE